MKNWIKFLLIPPAGYLLINTFTVLTGYQPAVDTFSSMLIALAFQLALILALPYAMLRLAPKAPYLATCCYMSALLAIVCLNKIYAAAQPIAQLDFAIIWSGLFWMLLAMAAYFFFQDPRFKVKYGNRRNPAQP